MAGQPFDESAGMVCELSGGSKVRPAVVSFPCEQSSEDTRNSGALEAQSPLCSSGVWHTSYAYALRRFHQSSAYCLVALYS